MSSRLWEGPSGNGFVSSRRISWDQEQGWAGGQNRDEHQASLSQPTGHLSASRRTSFPSSDETNLRLPSHEIPLISRVGAPTRRPRTPRNESAVKDGRKFLAAFREKRRNDDTGGSTSVPAAKKRGIDSLDVPPGLADAFTERLEVYQSCAPGLARSLEAALNASSLHRKHLGEDGTEGGDAGGGLKDGSEELHDHVMIDSVGDTRGNHDVSRGDIDDSLQRSNGTAAQPPPSMASSSSEGPTPETLREAARSSQAEFLSTVLPSGGDTASSSPPITPRPEHWSSVAEAVPKPQRGVDGGTAGTGADHGSSSSAADDNAVARWASLQRLRDQSVGLGGAAQHQLGRALELCRGLRGLKNGAAGSGVALGHQQTSWLDALQSALHGLEEVLAKRGAMDKAARQEAATLGGPAVVTTLLDGGRLAPADVALGAGSRDERVGWFTGVQLKGFEEAIQARYTVEIAALESERSKLRSKVDMFQRQVQFLQRDSSSHQSYTAPIRRSQARGGGSGTMGEEDDTGGKRIAHELDTRLGEARRLQGTLEAEVTSLRGSLEEKNGLIDALREALRATATPGETDGGTAVGSSPTAPQVPEHASVSRLVANGRAVPGRGVFARSNRPNRGRYHSRSSRLLGTPGPVAMAEAQAAATVAATHAGGPHPSTWNGSPPIVHSREVEKADEAPAGGAVEDTPLLPPGARVGDVTAAAAGTSDRVGTAPVPSALVSPATMSQSDDEGAPEASASAASSAAHEEAKKEAHDGGNGGIVARATAVTGTAWRVLWGSARVVGSRVGMDRGPEVARPSPRRRDKSSHAVMIF